MVTPGDVAVIDSSLIAKTCDPAISGILCAKPKLAEGLHGRQYIIIGKLLAPLSLLEAVQRP
ncbi:MAG: hypothetical protein ACLSAP_00390 [Oscillospiraceae bacterium]